jgi:hypothetical protein
MWLSGKVGQMATGSFVRLDRGLTLKLAADTSWRF